MKKRTYQQYYADIAQAIRNKGGSGRLTPAQMPSAIRGLSVSGLGTVTTFPSSGGYGSYAMTDPANYTAIAAAIRAKAGTTDKYIPSQMAAVIQAMIRSPVPTVRLICYTRLHSWMGLKINGKLIGGDTTTASDYSCVHVDIPNVPVGTWDVYAGKFANSNSCIGSITIPDHYTGSSLTVTV